MVNTNMASSDMDDRRW